MEFSYTIVEQLLGREAVEKVNGGVCAPLYAHNKAVFLDRDGVLNASVVREGKPYPPQTLDEIQILPGVAEACARLKRAGDQLFVVTNLPDVGRGTQAHVNVEVMDAILLQQLPIDRVEVSYDAHDSETSKRKPSPAMILDSARVLGVDLAQSFMVGDRWRDIDCGFNAGCRTIFIDYGYDEKLRHAPDFTVKSLAEAAEIILGL